MSGLRGKLIQGHQPWQDLLRRYTTPPSPAARPADNTDVLHHHGITITHPAHALTGHQPNTPKVHYGPVGSGNRLIRDAAFRDSLAHRHRIIAIEMEAAGIAATTDLHGRSWFSIRGITDYCDDTKDDTWHAYAALAAATYLRALLAECRPNT